MTGAYFDALAATYDQVWSEAAIGRAQRDAVWRVMDDEFCAGDRVLDIGCGTGVDAVHLGRRGVTVVGIDASVEMVHRAKSKGVDARHLAVENLREVEGPFDGAISNFGALNCVGDLAGVAANLWRLIVPGGRVAICVMGPVCAWEIGFFLLHLNPRKALRRFVADAPQQRAQEFRAIGENDLSHAALPAAFVAQPLRLQRRDSSRRLWPRPTDRTRVGELPLECPRHENRRPVSAPLCSAQSRRSEEPSASEERHAETSLRTPEVEEIGVSQFLWRGHSCERQLSLEGVVRAHAAKGADMSVGATKTAGTDSQPATAARVPPLHAEACATTLGSSHFPLQPEIAGVRSGVRSLGAAGTSARATRGQAAIYYPTIHQLTRAFAPHFQLLHWCGIGLSVPPSYVKSLSVRTIARLAAIDQRIAYIPGLRALADHRLLVFQRV